MWEYILLGIMQGIFEWLPISSEGVTALTSQFLIEGFNPVDVALFMHLGTFFVILIYFRKEWWDILTMKNRMMFKFLVIATIVSLAIGYPLYQIVSGMIMGSVLLLVMGIGLLVTAYFHRTEKGRFVGFYKLGVLSGFLQGLAVIPGLSRSGSTIFGLSFGNLSPSNVLKLSYMMSAPVVLISSIFIYISNPVIIEGWPALISAFVVGLISLHFLMRISQRINFYRFALIFAILCFIGAGITYIVM